MREGFYRRALAVLALVVGMGVAGPAVSASAASASPAPSTASVLPVGHTSVAQPLGVNDWWW